VNNRLKTNQQTRIEPTHSQKRRFKKKTVVVLSSLIIIIGTFFYIMNHPYLQVKEVQITGQRTLVETDIKKSLDNYFKEKYLWIIPKSNVILLNSDQIKKNLQIIYPKIQDIDVDIDKGDIVIITIGERRAHSLWCVDKTYESVFDEECYFADQTGLLYTQAPYFSGNVYLKNYYDENREKPLAVGVQVLEDDFESFFKFLEVLEIEQSLKIYRTIFAGYGDVRIELSRLENKLYKKPRPIIIFNQADDYIDILVAINVTLKFDTFLKDFRSKPEQLESIDVRFGDRVFYTFNPLDSRVDIKTELEIE
jgi:hypothetical protein